MTYTCCQTWDDGGVFSVEERGEIDAQDRQNLEDMRVHFELRPRAQVYNSYKAYQRAVFDQNRNVTIGRFIAFHVDWDANEVPERDRQAFWVGKVTDIDDDEVTVHYYHTGQQAAKDYSRAVFKPWTRGKKAVKVGRDAVIEVFDKLTDGGMLPAPTRRYILGKVRAGRSQPDNSSNLSEVEQSEDSDNYVISGISSGDDSSDTTVQQNPIGGQSGNATRKRKRGNRSKGRHSSDTPVRQNRRNQRGGQSMNATRKRKRNNRSKERRSSDTPVQTNRRSQRGGQGGNGKRRRKDSRKPKPTPTSRARKKTTSADTRRRTRRSSA